MKDFSKNNIPTYSTFIKSVLKILNRLGADYHQITEKKIRRKKNEKKIFPVNSVVNTYMLHT